MTKRKKPHPLESGRDGALTLHLGKEGFRHLERCRALIYRDGKGGEMPSRGQLVRQAIQRMLLCLLRDEVEWDRSRTDLVSEYMQEREKAGILDRPTYLADREGSGSAPLPDPEKAKSTKKRKGAK